MITIITINFSSSADCYNVRISVQMKTKDKINII